MTEINPSDNVVGWLWDLAGSDELNLPPFVLELVLRDSRSYFVRCVLDADEPSLTMGFRVWDLRAINDDDLEELKATISEAEDFHGPEDLHPRLDQSNLRVPVDAIWYCIEHHHRYWPEAISKRAGFGE